MIVVTGGAGMIGSNIVAALNAEGRDDIVVVDDLTDGRKIFNLSDLAVADYLDKDEFLPAWRPGRWARSRRCSIRAPAPPPPSGTAGS